MPPRPAPYGSWKSPITADLLVSDAVARERIRIDGADVYWVETRPSEGGRSVVVRRDGSGVVSDVTPAGFSVRTRVHEYGGGAYVVDRGVAYFSNFADQRLYRQAPGRGPEPLTPAGGLRYADLAVDRRRRRLICVREDHAAGRPEAVNTLAAAPLDGGDSRVLAAGADFYSSPRLHPDGSRLAWLAWSRPNMPWDGAELWTGRFDAAGRIDEPAKIAGGPAESIFQPAWSPGGVLHFVSDRSGWWNLYRWRGGRAERLHAMEAEFGAPQWSLGMSTYGFAGPDLIVCAYARRGSWTLAVLDAARGRFDPIETGFSDISSVAADAGRAVFRGASPTCGPVVAGVDVASRRTEVLGRAAGTDAPPEAISTPEALEFPSTDGATAHAFLYRPANAAFTGPAGERPPLLVRTHGGPTGAATTGLDMAVQYWTSRGFAVLDVNYGGSSGYGREYRRRLDGAWGVVDVDDCVNGARLLAARGEVDGARLAIRGNSAGGYTTLCALAFRDVFSAGACSYGVSDLEALARSTHKFESRYLDRLVAPYPRRRDVLAARSPVHHAAGLSCPVVLFQGLEDRIAPPDQATRMADALRAKGLPVALVLYEGEQHGFRRAETIRRTFEGELYFYSRIFGFPLPDPIEPLAVDNLPEPAGTSRPPAGSAGRAAAGCRTGAAPDRS